MTTPKTFCGARIPFQYGYTACGSELHGKRIQCDKCKTYDKPTRITYGADGRPMIHKLEV